MDEANQFHMLHDWFFVFQPNILSDSFCGFLVAGFWTSHTIRAIIVLNLLYNLVDDAKEVISVQKRGQQDEVLGVQNDLDYLQKTSVKNTTCFFYQHKDHEGMQNVVVDQRCQKMGFARVICFLKIGKSSLRIRML